MKVADKPSSAAQVRVAAEAWYQQQVARISQCMGPSWPEHCEWIESYLAEEVRQRLIAQGWRPKR